MTFYTKTGDDGTTGLLGKDRVKKYDLRMETIGSLDETSAALGLCRSFVCSIEIQEIVLKVQKQLYLVMGEVASEKDVAEKFRVINQESVTWIENTIENISQKTTIPSEFIVPGDTKGGAFLALSRTIVRRAERRLAELLDLGIIENQELLRFLNRLSSLLFILELYENIIVGKGDQTLVK
ncbi:MAG: ATP:cob(I)alamin adenosyltransferase [Chloroflexi bacterium HGW-Chloroflexi-3]|nr:MAG: ATP:cob(I)alamin adenosyltransferase [Chloroflexi bacterium HGW-Chloroflexi-3]